MIIVKNARDNVSCLTVSVMKNHVMIMTQQLIPWTHKLNVVYYCVRPASIEMKAKQILENQMIIAKLETIRDNDGQEIITDEILQIMEKYFGKRTA